MHLFILITWFYSNYNSFSLIEIYANCFKFWKKFRGFSASGLQCTLGERFVIRSPCFSWYFTDYNFNNYSLLLLCVAGWYSNWPDQCMLSLISSLIKQRFPPTPLTLKYHFGSDGQNSGQFWYTAWWCTFYSSPFQGLRY